MSGHSKWHSIKHKKGAADAKRGAIFTRHAKNITIAAREGGGDISMNPSLRLAIEKAKADNMPNANIDRAVKKGTGELGGGPLMELAYEGYGPEGVAILIQTLTDNKNRTVSNIRSIFFKCGGNLGETGSVAWMFHKKGILTLDSEGIEEDTIMTAALEAGADDIVIEGETITIETDQNDVTKINDILSDAGYTVRTAEKQMIPENMVKIESIDVARRIIRMVEALEEDDDVSSVAGNFDIPMDILEQL